MAVETSNFFFRKAHCLPSRCICRVNSSFLEIQFGFDVDLNRFGQKEAGQRELALDVPKISIVAFHCSCLNISVQYAPFKDNRLCSYFQALQNSTLSPL
jgi:hypothetical protein